MLSRGRSRFPPVFLRLRLLNVKETKIEAILTSANADIAEFSYCGILPLSTLIYFHWLPLLARFVIGSLPRSSSKSLARAPAQHNEK
jgi:hypothetical protein